MKGHVNVTYDFRQQDNNLLIVVKTSRIRFTHSYTHLLTFII